ncbi:hypothetical protein EVAR_876_1 [Eumeta japonica]|uniref:Uncharacterized protein n=1 Tax=Eumeta variegata TaxID=151549 RepID=A0A4C1SDN1_EUMVA|nr:hypothetical protein EVAR_876_1 [Eumeta japonica]
MNRCLHKEDFLLHTNMELYARGREREVKSRERPLRDSLQPYIERQSKRKVTNMNDEIRKRTSRLRFGGYVKPSTMDVMDTSVAMIISSTRSALR